MERAANIILQFADRVRKSTSPHLHFQFNEKSGYESGKYQRFRRITSDFQLTAPLEETLRNWLAKTDWPNPDRIRLTNDKIDVVIQWKKYVHPEGRTFSSMPAIAYDIEDNPVYRRLKSKRSQLSGAPEGSLRCIFLGDAGCDILRNLSRSDLTGRVVSGEQIIHHFLKKSSVDLVVVFSAQRKHASNPIGSPRIWRVTYFDKREAMPPSECLGLQAIARTLPAPTYEAY